MIKTILYAIALCLVLFSCKKEPGDCFVSTGKIMSQSRQISDFTELKMMDNVDVELFSSDDNRIEVTAGENIIDNIVTKVIDKEIMQDTLMIKSKLLVIENLSECNWLRSYNDPIKVKVFYNTKLKAIEYRSIGNLNCGNTIRSDTFFIDIKEGAGSIHLKLDCFQSHLNFYYGTADLTATGVSGLNYVFQASYGPVDARDLLAKFCYIENKSSNNCFVNAETFLGATISSIGDVYYSGNPLGKELNKNGLGNFYELKP
ncbi:MAG: DUF2807 domain-containing protein [Bacteroidales bacterium]|jgi:hypothetical protein